MNVGRLVAGTGRNIIADRAEMLVEVRGQTEATLALMERRAMEVLRGAAAMQGCTLETRIMGGTIGAAPSAAAIAIVAAAGARVEGIDEVVPGWPIGGGDDATFMMRRVQEHGGEAVYFILGSDLPAVHHASDFDIDERALDHGVRLFERIAAEVLAAP